MNIRRFLVPKTLLSAFALLLLVGCGSTPLARLDLQASPAGARVFLSLRGDRAYTGKLGPIRGDVKSESFEEDFVLLGTAPLIFDVALRETESDATILGVGGKVVRKYKEGVLRFEKPGFETAERRVRLAEGTTEVQVDLLSTDPPARP